MQMEPDIDGVCADHQVTVYSIMHQGKPIYYWSAGAWRLAIEDLEFYGHAFDADKHHITFWDADTLAQGIAEVLNREFVWNHEEKLARAAYVRTEPYVVRGMSGDHGCAQATAKPERT